MAGIYDLTLANNAADRLAVLGSYIKVISAPQGAIKVKLDGGESFQLLEGQGLRLEDAAALFRDVYVQNVSGASQTVQLFIGTRRFEDTRITGNVRVIDQSIDKVSAGSQFFQSVTENAFAGQGSVIILHPNGSAKRIAVHQLVISSSIAGTVLIGTGTGGGTALGGGSIQPGSKNLNGTGAESRIIGTTLAAASPVVGEITGLMQRFRVYIQANTTLVLPLKTPLVLTGTNNIWFSAEALNRDLVVGFELEEAA